MKNRTYKKNNFNIKNKKKRNVNILKDYNIY